MIEINTKRIKVVLAAISAAALLLGIFRGVLLFEYIEPETGFYIVGTNLDTVFNVLLGVLVFVILAAGFAVRKNKAPEFLDSKSPVVVFSSALCAMMFVTVFIYGIYRLFTSDTLDYFEFAQVVLALPCIANHIFICSKEIREKNAPQTLLALSEPLFFAVCIVKIFLDTSSQINTSQRSLTLVMLCAMMLFFLYEAKFQIRIVDEKKNTVTKYVVAGLATVALALVVVVPYLTSCLFWHFESGNLMIDVLECSVMLYAASRLLAFRKD